MYKKILLSLGTIVAVAAVAITSTGAFFNDTETSTGNTFTAGAIDLKVDSTQHYAGLVCVADQVGPGHHWIQDTVMGPNPTTRPDLLNQPCSGTWELKDLVPEIDKFFNFSDVKPGDSGENTISLHIDNNDAYACADLSNIANNDNTHLTPETNAGDVTPGPIGQGELGQNLDFLVWNDNGVGVGHAGNNIWDADEVGTNTTGGAPSANATYTLADSSGPAIPPTGTSYLGLAWCAGTFTAGGPGITPVCDGTSMGNEAQTDSYSADIGIRVVQARNNGDFKCTPPVTPNLLTCFDGPSDQSIYGGLCSISNNIATLTNNDGDPDGDYSGVYYPTSTFQGMLLGSIGPLGYTYSGPTPTPGGLSLNVHLDEDNNGTTDEYAFVDAAYCPGTAGVVNVITDASCGIYVGGITFYANWAALVAAHPTWKFATDGVPFIVAETVPTVWTVSNVNLGQ